MIAASLTRRAPSAPCAVRTTLLRIAPWRALLRERRALATLDTRLSRDIGIDTAEAAREAARPFWDALRGR